MSREARAQMKSQQGWVASGRDFRKLVERMESIFFSRWEKKKCQEGRQEGGRQRMQPLLCNQAQAANNPQEKSHPDWRDPHQGQGPGKWGGTEGED